MAGTVARATLRNSYLAALHNPDGRRRLRLGPSLFALHLTNQAVPKGRGGVGAEGWEQSKKRGILLGAVNATSAAHRPARRLFLAAERAARILATFSSRIQTSFLSLQPF